MSNPLYLNGKGAINTRLSAIENVLNEITKQMYEGKVPQAEADIINNKASAEAATLNAELGITDQDLLNIENGLLITDLDLRVMELEANNE